MSEVAHIFCKYFDDELRNFFCVWRCVLLNYYGALANALVVSGKT